MGKELFAVRVDTDSPEPDAQTSATSDLELAEDEPDYPKIPVNRRRFGFQA